MVLCIIDWSCLRRQRKAKPTAAASERGFGKYGRSIAGDVESPSLLPLLLLLPPPPPLAVVGKARLTKAGRRRQRQGSKVPKRLLRSYYCRLNQPICDHRALISPGWIWKNGLMWTHTLEIDIRAKTEVNMTWIYSPLKNRIYPVFRYII